MLVDFILGKKREYRKWSEKRKWRHYPQYTNGTLITGRLTECDFAAATQATTHLSSAAGQGHDVPFIPPEIVREIIRHATDTFPAPFSIHNPIPSASQRFSPPPPSYPRFPYWSCAFHEDGEVDRKLHALSMKIKLSVSRVSRAWRGVAAEFLFNSIRIYDSKQLPLLWRAFEGDARRRGEAASKETMAPLGSAPWWIRELWIDFEKIKHIARYDPTEFCLADLLKICPNIVVYRGLGTWKQFPFSPPPKHTVALKQVFGLPDEQENEPDSEVHEIQGREFDVQGTRRRIELCFAFEWELSLPLYVNRQPITPRILALPCILSMDLRGLYLLVSTNLVTYDTFRLQNLIHLSLRGADSVRCATTSLILPALRSVAFCADGRSPTRYQREYDLLYFLEKHGLAVEELTVLERSYSRYFPRFLDRLCPILQTFRTYYSELPRSPVRSVRNVGLYGLEHAGRGSESGESVVSNIFRIFPEVTTIQDLSWRSSVIRRRAYTNWTDPEGAKWREFWTQVIRAVRTGSETPLSTGSHEQFPVRTVALLDWRGKPVEAVPIKPPGGQCAIVSPDDQLLDALVSRGRHLI